jgi:hypothetical protein
MYRILLTAAVLTISMGCSSLGDVLVKGSKSGSQSTSRTTTCTVDNADGVRCDVKTCKADAASDCSKFKEACTNSGHSYEGNADKGTCTRGNGTPT